MRWRDQRTSPAKGIACASASDRSNTGKRREADRVGRQVAGLAGMRSALPLSMTTPLPPQLTLPLTPPPSSVSLPPATSLPAFGATTFGCVCTQICRCVRVCVIKDIALFGNPSKNLSYNCYVPKFYTFFTLAFAFAIRCPRHSFHDIGTILRCCAAFLEHRMWSCDKFWDLRRQGNGVVRLYKSMWSQQFGAVCLGS